MSKINIIVEGIKYEVDDKQTLLEALRVCGYNVPSLCSWQHGKCSLASCRVCLVKVKGERRLVPSCAYPLRDGLEVSINDPEAVIARRTSVELLLSNHSFDCQSCPKNGQCELLEVSRIVGARPDMYKGAKTETTYDDLAYGIIRDTSKCILSFVFGAAIKNNSFTGCPSNALNSTPSGTTIAESPGFDTESALPCGIAIPSPIPVVPSSSLFITTYL